MWMNLKIVLREKINTRASTVGLDLQVIPRICKSIETKQVGGGQEPQEREDEQCLLPGHGVSL